MKKKDVCEMWIRAHLRRNWLVVSGKSGVYALKQKGECTHIKKYGGPKVVCEAPLCDFTLSLVERVFEWHETERRKAEAERRAAERREAEARREAEREAERRAAERRKEIQKEFEEVRGLFESSLEALDGIEFSKPARRFAPPVWREVMADVAAKNGGAEAWQVMSVRAERIGLVLPSATDPANVAKVLEVLERAGAREGDIVAFPKSVREAKRLAALVREKREEEAAFAAAFKAARSGGDARQIYEALPMRIRQRMKYKHFLALVDEREEWMRSR